MGVAERRYTVRDLAKMKGACRQIVMVTAYDAIMARLADEAGVHILLVGDSMGNTVLGYENTIPVTMEESLALTAAVRRGARHAMVIGDMPFMSYQVSLEEAVANAGRYLKEVGADGVKLEGGRVMHGVISRLVDVGIPVMGHIGLTPQNATQLGGFKVQGGTPESARQLIEDAKELEKAGAFSIVLECVPKVVGKAVSEAVKIPILGIGAGPFVDCQVLVTQDLLGMYGDFKPKFVKLYANVRKVMVDGLNQFHKEALDGEFPSDEYSFNKEVNLEKLY